MNKVTEKKKLSELPIVWHESTPTRFSCQEGCLCCCIGTLFFPSEASGAPQEVQEGLDFRDGLIRAKLRPPGFCVFFDESRPWHCQIPEYRALRCDIYPFLPLVTPEAIVIVAEVFTTIINPKKDDPFWYRCYGLGKGSSVVAKVEEAARLFLSRLEEEYPGFIEQYLTVDTVDEWIDHREIEKYASPLLEHWDLERIRQIADRPTDRS